MRKIVFAIITLMALIQIAPDFAIAGTTEPVAGLRVDASLLNNGSVDVKQSIDFYSAVTLSWPVFSNFRNVSIEADGHKLPSSEYSTKNEDSRAQILSATAARKWVISYNTTTSLIRHDNRDQIFFKVIENPGRIISNIQINFSLPVQENVPDFGGNLYAIGGVAGARTLPPSAASITFLAAYASNTSLITFNASWPKTILKLSWFQENRLKLNNLDIIPWIVLGLLLPLLCLIILLRLVYRQYREDTDAFTTQVRSAPPNQLSPLIVGVLINKKIYPEEIVAMLIDLCQRGYLVIVRKNTDYYLGKRKPLDENLEPWEKNIMEEILTVEGQVISGEDLKAVSRKNLYSPRIHDAFDQIYQVSTDKQFFAENPHLTRIRYKLVALVSYYIGLAGAIWVVVTGASPYLILPLTSTMIIAWQIIRLTPQLIHYTDHGRQERRMWLQFATFLNSEKPLPPESSRNQMFESYLGYAIALGKTQAWAERFDNSSATVIRPDWFISYRETSTSEFVSELLEFTKTVSKILSNLRGPLVN